MSARRSWAALLTLGSVLLLAGASASEQPTPAPVHSDGGAPGRARDAGSPLAAARRDAGPSAPPLHPEDVEVLENLELLEHLPESDVLELLLPLRDE